MFLIIPYKLVLAGAWPQKEGSGYYKISFRYLSGEKIYNSDGVKVPIPKFTDFTVGLFGSYGFVCLVLIKSFTLNWTIFFPPDIN